MFYYARSDTHYLLYIYDMLRNELAGFTSETYPDVKPIDRVIQKSKEVSLQRYEHPFCDPETGAGNRGWYNTLIKSPTLYSGEQFAVYKAVHKWRDDVARREDESPPFIMAQQVLSDIARIMPTDMKALWSLLESNARGLKPRLNELFEVIQQARAKGASGPTMLEFFRQSYSGTVQTSLGDKSVATAAVPDAEPLSIEELKSGRSQLWGSVALNSTRDGSVKARPIDAREMIPLYSFDFGAVKEELPEVAAPPPKPSRAEVSAPSAAPADEGFTLKGGRKRKASDAADAEPASEAESVSSDVEMDDSPAAAGADVEGDDDAEALKEAQKQAKKAARKEYKKAQREAQQLIKQGKAQAAQDLLDEAKRNRKAAKRAQKQEQQQNTPSANGSSSNSSSGSPSGSTPAHTPSSDDVEGEEEEEEVEEQPFDYAKASSVLHAPRANPASQAGPKGKRGKKAVPFDPYAQKSGAAPQGARKLNYEKKGRTATFRK